MTLIYLAGAWLVGVAVAALTGDIVWAGAAGIGAAGLAAAVVTRKPQYALLGLLAAGAFIGGAWRFVDQQPSGVATGIALHNDVGTVRFRALVSDEPEVSGRTQRVRLSASEIFLDNGWQPIEGGVLLRQGRYPAYRYGDVLEIEGQLETPPSFPDFDYRDYLARRGVVSLISYPNTTRVVDTSQGNPALRIVHDVRRELGDAMTRVLPEPQAALAEGIFLGERSTIPDNLNEDLNTTGLTHLIAISGYNISIVAALMISALAWLIGRRQAAVVALVAIAGYTVLTGASPTVVRAAIMGGLFVVATLVGRPSSAGTSIALAGAIMTGWDPVVIEDISFQLSFAAILGIVYLASPLEDRGLLALRRRGVDADVGVAHFLLENMAITTAAVLATMPLFALYFDRVSIVTFVANLFLVPAFPLILVSSALTALCSVAWEPLGLATSWLSWALLTYMIEVAHFFAGMPLAALDIHGFGRWHAAIAYVALGLAAIWLARNRVDPNADNTPAKPKAMELQVSPVRALAGTALLVAAMVLWAAFGGGTHSRLTVAVLDVGQGDAILIETPEGQHLLIDGGADGQLLAERLGEELPFWEHTLDLIALTHPQEDHMAGLVDAVERYGVGEAMVTGRTTESPTYVALENSLQRAGIPTVNVIAGSFIDLGDGAVVRVLGPDDLSILAPNLNNSSLVLRLEYGRASFLLTGDIEAPGEEELLRSGEPLASTVLKVPHHGSKTSTTPAFLEEVHPAIAVVSVGEDNPYGHPSPAVIDRLDDDTLVLRTDEHGTVRLSTDGERMWVETAR